jgi:hypothetical protein
VDAESHMQVNMQEVIPGRGEEQKMSRGWSVSREEDRGKRVVLVRSPASRGVVPRHQDPNGWSALRWLTGLEKTPLKAEIACSMC